MAKIIPYDRCPSCGSNVLTMIAPMQYRVVYLHGKVVSRKSERVTSTCTLVCAKCGKSIFFNYKYRDSVVL